MSNIIQTVQMNLNKVTCLTIMIIFVANFNYCLCLKLCFCFGMVWIYYSQRTGQPFRKKIDNIIKNFFLLVVIY